MSSTSWSGSPRRKACPRSCGSWSARPASCGRGARRDALARDHRANARRGDELAARIGGSSSFGAGLVKHRADGAAGVGNAMQAPPCRMLPAEHRSGRTIISATAPAPAEISTRRTPIRPGNSGASRACTDSGLCMGVSIEEVGRAIHIDRLRLCVAGQAPPTHRGAMPMRLALDSFNAASSRFKELVRRWPRRSRAAIRLKCRRPRVPADSPTRQC